MALPQPPKSTLQGVYSAAQTQQRRGLLLKKSAEGVIDPESLEKSTTLLSEYLKIATKVNQQNEKNTKSAEELHEEHKKQIDDLKEINSGKAKYLKSLKDEREALIKEQATLADTKDEQERWNKALKDNEANLQDVENSLKHNEQSIAAFTERQKEATKTTTGLSHAIQRMAVDATYWFAGKLKPLMQDWGATGRIAAKNYIEVGDSIADTNKGMVGTFGSVTTKMFETQKTIGAVSLEGAKLGFSLKESTDVISHAMDEVAISSKGALQAADFEKLGDDTLFFSRVLGIDASKTLKFFKTGLQKLNKTEEETAEDLLAVRNATDQLNKSVGKTVIKSGDFADMMTKIANNSSRATLNMKSLSGIAAVVGAEMAKTGLSVDKTAKAMQGLTEFLAKPAEEIDVTAGFKEVEEAEKAVAGGQAEINKYVQERFKTELAAITNEEDRRKQELVYQQGIEKLADKTVGKYSRALESGEMFGGTEKGIENRLKSIKDLYIKGGGEEAASVLRDRIPELKDNIQGSIELAKLLDKEDFAGAAKTFAESQSPEKLKEQKKNIEGNVKGAGVYAGGLDTLPTNIWDAALANPVIKSAYTGLAALANVVLIGAQTANTINTLKPLITEVLKKGGGGGGAITGGATAAAEAGTTITGGATAAAGGGAKTLVKLTSALGKVSKAIPFLGAAIDLGVGAYEYSQAESPEDKKKVVGKTAGGATGALIGGALGTFIGGPLGTVVGSALGSWLGGAGGKMLVENWDAITDRVGKMFTHFGNILSVTGGMVSDALSLAFKPITDSDLWKEFAAGWDSLLSDLADGWVSFSNKASEAWDGVLTSIADSWYSNVTEPFGRFSAWVKSFFDDKSMIGQAGNAIGGVASNVWNTLSGVGGAIAEDFNTKLAAVEQPTIPNSIRNPDTGTALAQQREADQQKQAAMALAARSQASNQSQSSNDLMSGLQSIDFSSANSVGDRTAHLTVKVRGMPG